MLQYLRESHHEPISTSTLLRWAQQAAEALLFIHANGVCHGDVSCTSNVSGLIAVCVAVGLYSDCLTYHHTRVLQTHSGHRVGQHLVGARARASLLVLADLPGSRLIRNIRSLRTTAVVTPLGLHQGTAAQSPAPAQFHYIEDTSAFGSGTPPRDENSRFSRVCSGLGFETCPHSSGNVVSTTNESGIFVTGDWYNTRVSQDVMDCFQSGLLTMEPSVSSLFDIQARYTVMSPASDPDEFIPFDNNTAYPLSQLRPIQSLVTDGGYKLVEGLVVDLQAGGIGFRNHSAPPWRPHGSEWSEDRLFVEPETQCVDLNLTLDYDVVTSSSGSGGYENFVLTDRGGFANFQKDFSPTNWTTERSQSDPELTQRALSAALVNNFVSMLFLNVTNPNHYNGLGESAFRYLNSHVGKTFPLLREGAGTTNLGFLEYMSLQTSTKYGAYLQGTDNAFTGVNFSDTGSGNLTSFPAIHPNPFGIERQNFTGAVPLCSRTTTWDYANITNIAVGCGLVYGAPQRLTAGDTLIFRDPGSKWSIPVYSCATGVRAILKTVSFRFNGTDNLAGLMPLGRVRPLWGLVTSENARQLGGLATLHNDHLWLSGFVDPDLVSEEPDNHNLPGVDFYRTALSRTFAVNSGGRVGFFDYSGTTSIALLRKW
ncbi:hypothetical protein BJX62DRAFT_242026 [Aspergillus germanicus]